MPKGAKMRKFMFIFVIMGLLISTNANAQGLLDLFRSDPTPVVTDTFPKDLGNYGVTIFNIGDEMGSCSGVVIKEDEKNMYVLTAKHCVELGREMWVENNLVTLAITSTEQDLAYLVVSGHIPNKVPVVLASVNPKIGDKLYHIAYPMWDEYKSEGKLIRISKDWEWSDLASKHGCSGGGIFNEKSELVGILWGGLSSKPVSIYNGLNNINKFLDEINKHLK
jgi:S1-C subfamily serine protease